jgi:hypothetical protein
MPRRALVVALGCLAAIGATGCRCNDGLVGCEPPPYGECNWSAAGLGTVMMDGGLAAEPTMAIAIDDWRPGLTIVLSDSAAGICPADGPTDQVHVSLTFEIPPDDNGPIKAGTYPIIPVNLQLDAGYATAAVAYCPVSGGCSPTSYGEGPFLQSIYANSGTLTISSARCPITGSFVAYFPAEYPLDAGDLPTTGSFIAPVCELYLP